MSEYNMLYYKHTLYIIDVSQSVEMDHPSAQEFLRMDCRNVTDYFTRAPPKGTLTPMTPRELYEFIVDDTIVDTDTLDTGVKDVDGDGPWVTVAAGSGGSAEVKRTPTFVFVSCLFPGYVFQ